MHFCPKRLLYTMYQQTVQTLLKGSSYAAFHFGLLFLPKYLFTDIQYLSVEQNLNKCFNHNYLNGTKCTTVNSEIFARVLFTLSFVKIKPSRESEIILSFIDEGKS